MSIALDFALFIRNSTTKLNLSAATIAIGYTLAFRVGSNTFTWVSQKELAEEIGMDESNIRKHCKKLAQAGFIGIESDRKDKRKNVYTFTKSILNYHAMSDSQKRECHNKLKDVYKFTARNHPVKNADTARNHPVNTARNHPVSSDAKSSTAHENKGLQETVSSAKGTLYNNTKSKQPVNSRKKRGLISDSFYPNHDNQKLADKVATQTGKTGSYLVKRFVDVMKKHAVESDNFDERFTTFLMNELPSKPKQQTGVKQAGVYF